MNITAAIQAGGRSSRMGADKAWLELAGHPLIEHVLAAAQPVVEHLAIVVNVANPQLERYENLAAKWEAHLLSDLHEQRGPLGGLHTALRHAETVLLLPCDLPFLTADFLALLGRIHQNANCALTAPLDQTQRLQMLAGFYEQTCCAPVEQMLAAAELKIDRLCLRVPTRRVAFSEYAHLPNAARLLSNINTPEQYQQAQSQQVVN